MVTTSKNIKGDGPAAKVEPTPADDATAKYVNPLTGTEREVEDRRALEPSFGLSEGTRQELEMFGHATSPFTGALLVGSGPDDVREVDAKEYHRVAREAANRAAQPKLKGTRFPKG